MRQEHETFVPHVLAITRGSTRRLPERRSVFPQRLLAVARGDVRSRPLSAGTGRDRRSSRRPGLVKVFCHIHSHMSAAILVLDHPYFAMPDDDGVVRRSRTCRPVNTRRRLARARRRADGDVRVEPAGRRRRADAAGRGSAVSRTERTSAAPPGQDAGRHLRHRRAAARRRLRRRLRSACAIRCARR